MGAGRAGRVEQWFSESNMMRLDSVWRLDNYVWAMQLYIKLSCVFGLSINLAHREVLRQARCHVVGLKDGQLGGLQGEGLRVRTNMLSHTPSTLLSHSVRALTSVRPWEPIMAT